MEIGLRAAAPNDEEAGVEPGRLIEVEVGLDVGGKREPIERRLEHPKRLFVAAETQAMSLCHSGDMAA